MTFSFLNPPLRPLHRARDLMAVADLIELCFASTMDADGRLYLQQMRETAREAAAIDWAVSGLEQAAGVPLEGFVWEEDNRLVGNLTLITLRRMNRRVFFVANVAVHTDYRRRGIGRKLTQAAIDYTRAFGAWEVWLQVRAENTPAVQLYESLGFTTVAARSAWVSGQAQPRPLQPRAAVTNRGAVDWPRQREWLMETYPDDLTWHLPLNIDAFQPSFLRDLMHTFDGSRPVHWSARMGSALLGLLTLEASRLTTDNLWLAAPSYDAVDAILALVPHALQNLRSGRQATLNFPAGQCDSVLQAVGLTLHQTLVWMKIAF